MVVLSSAAYFVTHSVFSRPGRPIEAQGTAARVESADSPDKPGQNVSSRPAVPQPREAPNRGADKDLHTTFSDLHQCYSSSQAVNAAKSRADCSFFNSKPGFEKAYAECLARAQDEVNAMHSAAASMKNCPADEGALIADYYQATKKAARAGDVDAQYCYLFSHFEDSQGHSHYTSQDIEDYKADSPKYVAAAFKRGDWRIVSLLSTHFTDPPRSLLPLLDGIGQAETIYKMTKLLRLGATGDYAASLDNTLNLYLHPAQNGSSDSLPKDKIAEDDKWAQETYEQHFQGQRPLTEPLRAFCHPTK